jgi:hypothetical protein
MDAARARRVRRLIVWRDSHWLVALNIFAILQRMRLYQREYGLTELRLYVTGAMIWLAVVFVWAAATVLRGRRQLFAVGALVSGFAAIFAMNVVNPYALIARTNLDRPRLDLPYLMNLSDDATPELVKALSTLEPRLREQLARRARVAATELGLADLELEPVPAPARAPKSDALALVLGERKLPPELDRQAKLDVLVDKPMRGDVVHAARAEPIADPLDELLGRRGS